MSDQTDAVVFTGPGKSGNPSDQEATTAQQQVLTRKDMDQMVNDITEQVVRRTQGLIDSQTSNINKRIQDGLSNLKSVIEVQRNAGIDITPEQEQALRQRVIAEAYTAEGPTAPTDPSKGTRQTQPEPQGGQEIDPVTAEAIAMMEEAGVWISDTDPEAEKMRQAKTPRQYFKAVEEAIQLKQERTSQTKPETGADTGDRSPTNLGGSGGSKASLRRQYQEEAKKVRGDVWAVTELKRKYRKLGLDI